MTRPASAEPGAAQVLVEVLTSYKWAPAVISVLDGAPPRRLRFTEVLEQIDGISRQVLSDTLQGLERDGFVRRTEYAGVPPRVEYALTDLGLTFCGAMQALMAWAHEHAPAVLASRRRYDEARTT